MAHSSIEPGRRDEHPADPAVPENDPTGPDRSVPDTGRDYVAGDPDTPRQDPLSEGADDGISGESVGETRAAGAEPPALDDDPIDPHGREAHDPHGDEMDDHAGRSGFAATALKILVFVLVIFGLSLWIVPNVAPHLPAGIGRHLMPGQAELDARLAALTEQIEAGTAGVSGELAALSEQVANLSQRLEMVEQTAQSAQASAADSAAAAERNAVAGDAVARAEAAAAEASRLADMASTAATQAGEVAASATRETAELARRTGEMETRLTELADRVQAVSDSLAEGVADGEASAPEMAAAVAALQSQIQSFRARLDEQPAYLTAAEAERFATQDDLRAARMAMLAEVQQAVRALPPAETIVVEEELASLRQEAEAALGLLERRLNEIAATAGEASQTAATAAEAATQAVGRVDDAIREAALRAAAAALISRLQNGLPFADALQEAAELQGEPPPEALTAVAESGVPTTAELLRRFGRPARDALEADIEARTGGGILGQASARVRSVIAGRPAGEQPGDTADAVLSRIEARLREGDAAAALAEAESLPNSARNALGDWLDRLRARVAAAEAAERWLTSAAAGTQG